MRDRRFMSERPAGYPLTKQRIDHNIARALLEQNILLRERCKGGLDARRATKAMTGSRVGRMELAAGLKHHGSQRRALLQRQPLPERFEDRLLLRHQPRQRVMQVLERRPSSAAR